MRNVIEGDNLDSSDGEEEAQSASPNGKSTAPCNTLGRLGKSGTSAVDIEVLVLKLGVMDQLFKYVAKQRSAWQKHVISAFG
jgi:hypothetical protein